MTSQDPERVSECLITPDADMLDSTANLGSAINNQIPRREEPPELTGMIHEEQPAHAVIFGRHRRCHQTELRLITRSRVKDGWWAGTTEVEINGQIVMLKRYEGSLREATQVWCFNHLCQQTCEVKFTPRSYGRMTSPSWTK